jgi:hypothetical protein
VYNNEETIWTNQILFQHRDNEFNSNSAIDASLSISTQDLKNFSNPFINLSITSLNDKKRRTCSLNLQLVNSILSSFNKLYESVERYYDEGNYEIVRKVSNKELQILFRRSKVDPKQKCVLISIVLNQSDFGRIILDFEVAKLLFGSLETLYDRSIAVEISNRCLLTSLLDKMDELDRSIKTLPSLIGVVNDIPRKVEQEAIGAPNYEELDKYIGGSEMSNIRVPELEGNGVIQAESSQVIHSELINNVLKDDITNIESLVHSSYVMDKPIMTIIDSIKHGPINTPEENFEFLPGISDNELKSLLYVSKITFSSAFQNYTLNGVPLPLGAPLLMFRPDVTKVKELNMEIALDLLMIVSYLKSLKERLGEKIEDANLNKSIIYYALRCFTDPLVFSFLDSSSKDTVKAMITRNFKFHKDNGFFKNYETLLDRHSCSQIMSDDVLKFVDGVFSRLSEKVYICETQDFMHSKGELVLPSNNALNIEQITKEVVKLEVAEKLGSDLTNQEEVGKYVDLNTVSKDIIKIFSEGKGRKLIDRKRETAISKYIKKYEEEIPESIRVEFTKHISEISSSVSNFDFKRSTFPVEQLGEHILKGLYEYNQSSKKEAYNNFFMRAEECLLSKDMIIAKMKTEQAQKTIDWDSLSK